MTNGFAYVIRSGKTTLADEGSSMTNELAYVIRKIYKLSSALSELADSAEASRTVFSPYAMVQLVSVMSSLVEELSDSAKDAKQKAEYSFNSYDKTKKDFTPCDVKGNQ